MKTSRLFILVVECVSAAAFATTLTINGALVEGDVTVVTGSGPNPPTGCTATINGGTSVQLASTGGQAALHIDGCSPATTTGEWYANGTGTGNRNADYIAVLPANSGQQPITYSYFNRVCNVGTCIPVPSAALTATVAAASVPPGVVMLNMDWNNPQRLFSGPLNCTDILVVQFTTGTKSSNTNMPRIAGAEWQSPVVHRWAVLSDTIGSFATTPAGSPQSWPGATSKGGTGSSNPFAVEGPNSNYWPILAKSKTYYLNVKAIDCQPGLKWDSFIDLSKNSAG